MQTFSTILLVCELILFTLLVANLGNLIINLLIDQDANSQFIGIDPLIYWIDPTLYLNQNNITRLNKIQINMKQETQEQLFSLLYSLEELFEYDKTEYGQELGELINKLQQELLNK